MIEGPPEMLKKVYDYEPGRHHPVYLGNILVGRYKVIHKLGNGSSANFWLCNEITSDSPRNGAVKVIMADESTGDRPELCVNKLARLPPCQYTCSDIWA